MLSTIKCKIISTPTFCDGAFIAKQPSCTMCQIRKKEHCNWLTPPLCIQRCSSNLTPMQILQMLRHGGNLKLWCDIGQFFVLWRYNEISPNNTSMGIVKNWRQRWTLSQQQWIHPFFIACTHISHPIFAAHHPQTMQIHQGDKHSLHCLFFLWKIVPWANISMPAIWPGRRLVGHRSCLLHACPSQTSH